MSDIAPPFVGFVELSQTPETTRNELLGKMLSGEHPTYVYSSEADGRLDPARITPAEFFKAWRRAQQDAGCDDCLDASGWPLKKMGPFQIRVPDRDIRRDRNRLVRRTIGVPHWIYLLKADLALPSGGNLPQMNYPGDALLIEEGIMMVAKGMKYRATARELAKRADGPNTDLSSKEDRLRKAIAAEHKRRLGGQ